MAELNDVNIVLGVTGGIAAYKSAELVRLLKKHGADVKVVLTPTAHEFITPLTLQTLSEHSVHTDLFDNASELAMSHIDLARWADLVLIAPATADLISKLSHGAANDLLSTLCLATTAPIIIAPAMNQQMWEHWATQENLAKLTTHRVQVIGPGVGEQACKEVGPGRMSEPSEIVEYLIAHQSTKALNNINVLITAGPTREAIDAVRFLSNESSGKMGFALAQAAAKAGANVTMISGPTSLTCSPSIKRIDVISSQEMFDAVHTYLSLQDIFISAAAVADYTLANPSTQKIKKSADTLQLELQKTKDILSSVGSLAQKPFLIGFAAETENLILNATKKLHDKNLDMVVANLVSDPSIGFTVDDNAVTVITSHQQTEFTKQPKSQLAKQLIELIANLYHSNRVPL